MARSLESDVLSNQNITSALEIGSYTAAATRIVYLRVLVDQAAGNGDYVIYATLQVGGSGSAYRLIPITTAAAANTVTAIGFISGGVPVENGDVLKVYLTGLAGDTTTPDTRVDYYEHNYLAPTTADRTLDVTATGEAGIDWANVGSPTTTVGLSGTTVKTATDVETDTADIQGRLPAALVSGRIDASVGAAAANTVTASALAADAVTEIQSGLATATVANTIELNVAAILDDTGTSGVKVATSQIFVKKNTALAGFMFTMIDSTTGDPVAGLTVTSTRSIDGAAFAACTNSAAGVSNGWYKIDLAAADLNGTVIAFRMTATGAKSRDFTIVTQA